MSYELALKYRPAQQPNDYMVYYQGYLIGMVCYTPGSNGTWTFYNTDAAVTTFGSTKYQAVKHYLDIFRENNWE